jgi:LysM repeat protein
MSLRRILPFILINIFVSTAVVLSILFWWDGRQNEVAGVSPAPSSGEVVGAVANTAVPQPNPTQPADQPVATEAPPLHIVQAGETLSTISTFYDVSMDDIMVANGMSNPNLISVGQQLVIPINGLEEPTAVPVAAPTEESSVIPTPISAEPVTGGNDYVVEISQVIGAGDLEAELLQIRNTGSSSVALQNWRIADQDGLFYTFGQITLFGDGAGLLIYSKQGQNNATEIYWGQANPVWTPGELVTLLDNNGDIVTTFIVPEG